jgi:hypothetical protein
MNSAEGTFCVRPQFWSESDLSTSGRLRLFLHTVLPSAMLKTKHTQPLSQFAYRELVQAVGISTHGLQSPIFTGPESANRLDSEVESFSSTGKAGKKFPVVENVSGFAAQASVHSRALQVRNLRQNFFPFLMTERLLQKSIKRVFVGTILCIGNVATAQNRRALAPSRADGR